MHAQIASDRLSYPKALCGRFEPRPDLPVWMRVPRWCTTDAPRWGEGQTAALIDGYADRGATVLRLGMFWGGLSHYPSRFAPPSPKLKEGVDPLAEALSTTRRRGMHLLAYINPNACYAKSPLYQDAYLVDETGVPWDVKAYGREGTRYACSNHPVFADFYGKAIGELVGTYGTDGIYVDGLTPHVCYCEHCERKFREDTGRDLPAGLTTLGPLSVLWEMTSDWDMVGDVTNADHVLYSRWLMKCLTDLTRMFSATAKAVKPEAVVVFHTWPKPDTLPHYDGTLNEIYAQRPWNFTLWKRAEFSNWGDAFSVPSLVNIYLRQEAWGQERRRVTSEAEARHLYWQALANGAFPNAWGTTGMERPFSVMKAHADCFDFPTTFPTTFLALPRPMFHDARLRAVRDGSLVPLQRGGWSRLRILEREPGGKIDLVCLRADGLEPSDAEYRRVAGGEAVGKVIYLSAAAFEPQASVTSAGERSWSKHADPEALSGFHMTSRGHGNTDTPEMALAYALPPIEHAGAWTLWARVIFPNVGSDSFYWQVSNDAGETWLPDTPRDECALGWEQPQAYGWVKARVVLTSPSDAQVDRFLSPAAGMFAALLHAGLPVKEIHPNHINRQSLDGFRVLVLAHEVCLSDEQGAMIRDFVRVGGGLIATHETSLYDLQGRRRDDFGLADVFGVELLGAVPSREGQSIEPADAARLGWPLLRQSIPNHEEHLLVEPNGADVAGWLTGAGVPGGRLPAATMHQYGQGRVVYFPGRLDSSYSLWADNAFVDLMRAAVLWVSDSSAPAQVLAPDAHVGVTCFEQPSCNRRLIHLVAYNVDWAESFDAIPPVTDVRVRLSVPKGRAIASVRALLAGQSLAVSGAEARPDVVLPRLDEYEILEVKWR